MKPCISGVVRGVGGPLRSSVVAAILLLLVWLTVTFILTGPIGSADAHEPHACKPGYPDAPSFSAHLDQEAISQGDISFDDLFANGRTLFQAVVNVCDGQDRPATTGTGNVRDPVGQPAFIRTSAPDSNSCAGCHNQPRSGGGSDFVANVFVLAQGLDPVTESISAEFSNDRNTLGMFGSAAVEMLGREMTNELLAIRDQAAEEAEATGEPVTSELVAKGVYFGVITVDPDGAVDASGVHGIDADLIVKPFHQAGVVRSIREFTVNAYNHHHGMQAEERFDLNPEKGVDFDQDGVDYELSIGDITAATIYQAALGVPGQALPEDAEALDRVARGEELFDQLECTSCHMPELQLDSPTFVEPYELNPAGTFNDASASYAFDMTTQGEGPYLEPAAGGGAIVRAYTDLKRHDLCDDSDHPDSIRFYCNEELAQNRPEQDGKPGTEFFLTRKLWDVGNSAPYGHRGDLTTITDAILVHGGEARDMRDAFAALPVDDQRQVVEFLNTLQVLPAGSDSVVTVDASGNVVQDESSNQTLAFTALSLMLVATIAVVALVVWRRIRASSEAA